MGKDIRKISTLKQFEENPRDINKKKGLSYE